MIDVSYLIANLDEILGDNMFLKDARKAENLKGSVYSTFSQIETQIDQIESQLSVATNTAFRSDEEIQKIKNALFEYLKSQIDNSQILLNSLNGGWY